MVIRALCVLLLVIVPAAGWADAGEASVDVHPLGGVAVLGDDAAGQPEHTARSHLAGAAARVTYATHDLIAWELEMGAAQSGVTTYPGVMVEDAKGDLTRITTLARAHVGVRLRLGARYIPTLLLAVGGQGRAGSTSRLRLADGAVLEGPRAPWSWALTVRGGLGFDYRVNARWMAGAAVSAIQAVPPLRGARFQSIEGGLHVAYVWYPRW
jgi:hypothetical protein